MHSTHPHFVNCILEKKRVINTVFVRKIILFLWGSFTIFLNSFQKIRRKKWDTYILSFFIKSNIS